MKKVELLVTGGDSFLGRHLVRKLLSRGYHVRVFSNSMKSELEKIGGQWLHGSVFDSQNLQKAMSGCHGVFHLADKMSFDSQDETEMNHIHIEGARLIVEAAKASQVRRVIFCSSAGTIACSSSSRRMNNEKNGDVQRLVSKIPFFRSKLAAERLAVALAEKYSLDLICINPGRMFGPGDNEGLSTNEIRNVLEQKTLAIPRGGINFVDVRDVALGAIAAFEKGTSGRRYLLGMANWTWDRILRQAGQIAHVEVPVLLIPHRTSYFVARFISVIFNLVGKPSPVHPAWIKMTGLYWYFDSSKARQELGFRVRDPNRTLIDTVVELQKRIKAKKLGLSGNRCIESKTKKV